MFELFYLLGKEQNISIYKYIVEAQGSYLKIKYYIIIQLNNLQRFKPMNMSRGIGSNTPKIKINNNVLFVVHL